MSHPLRRSFAAAAVAGLAVTATLTGASPAQSVPADPACPDAFPVSELEKGQPVDGLTVSAGTLPDQFTGEVLGVVKDGIAPGLDMVMVRLTSEEIDRVGGIWAGMSGSPVYAENGELIGAVAYGLAFGPSPVAGVTPAEEMKRLLGDPDAPAGLRPARKVALPGSLKKELVAAGDATAAEADSGLRRLPVPVGVSGMVSAARLDKAAKKLPLSDVRYYRAGAAAAVQADPSEIFAGSNLAGSLSYGDFSAVGTGTTTMVCDGKAVAFGHPFAFTGPASLTMHAADALFVQEDPTVFPFKVSNPTGMVGTISQDRLSGISGPVGPTPETALVRHQLTLTGGKTRTGLTDVSVPDFLPNATFFGQLVNQDRLMDRIGKGSSVVRFTVSGTTGDGAPFTFARTNRYASAGDISFESSFEAADAVFAIGQNEFTDVDIDEVSFNTSIDPENRSFRVGRVEQRFNGVYRVLSDSSVVKGRAGRYVVLRVTLNSFRNQFGTKRVLISVRIPQDAARGSFGTVLVGSRLGGDEELGGGSASGEPTSFDGLLQQLAQAPRNDELGLTLDLFDEEQGSAQSQESVKQLSSVLTGNRFFEFRIVR